MRSDVMGAMEGFAIFPIITLIIFVGFFAGLIYYVITMDKSKVDRLSDMPLDLEEEQNLSNQPILEQNGEKNHAS